MTAIGRYQTWLLAASLALAAGAAAADPGDIYQVTSARANLRSGPSDQTTVRSQVAQGDELIELRREGNWLGVRVLRTGEEGWVFRDLVDQVAQSQLNGGVGTAGFQELSQGFDQLMGRLGQQLGYPLVTGVAQGENGELRVTPTREFLLYSGRDVHVATTLAIYQMWKNHQNSAPVAVVLLGEDGRPYVSIQDRPAGPDLLLPVATVASS
jgi:uncharacterized protein YgiM (DUF1202 family)